MRLETQELRILVAVAEHRGFRRAAEQLSISQSAVSQAVTGLERKLGQKLLRRRPVELTDAGMRLLTYAQSHAREEAQLLQDLEGIRRGGQAHHAAIGADLDKGVDVVTIDFAQSLAQGVFRDFCDPCPTLR